MNSRKALQVATAILAAVPCITGMLAMLGVDDPLFHALNLPRDANLDSQLRFLGGVWLGLGLAAASLIPRIEAHTTLFRALWGMIFLGGVGRLLSLVLVGAPWPPFIGFTLLEVAGAPLFVWWQSRVAISAAQTATPQVAPGLQPL